MTRGPILGLVDVSKPFEIETDASEKEMLAMVHCLRVWRQYLLGSQFVVKTDNNVICHFFDQRKLTAKQAWWQESLAKFDFKFEHKIGKSNQAADALSRKGEHAALCMLAHIHSSKINGSMRDIIKEHLHRDPSAKAVVELAKAGKTRQFWVEETL